MQLSVECLAASTKRIEGKLIEWVACLTTCTIVRGEMLQLSIAEHAAVH